MSQVTFPASHGELRGYMAGPEGEGPWPGAIVIHDILGMTRDLREHADFDVSGVNYGEVPDDAVDVLAGSCPVVASFGARDRMLRGAADKLETALTKLGTEHDVKEYPDVGHSFMNKIGPRVFQVAAAVAGFGFDEDATADARRRILAFFGEHLP